MNYLPKVFVNQDTDAMCLLTYKNQKTGEKEIKVKEKGAHLGASVH